MNNSYVRPFRIVKRPGGDFAVQRFVVGRILRWGVYRTLQEARNNLRIANAPVCPFSDTVRAFSHD